MSEHAKEFPPSSAARFMNCAGSVILCANEPDVENEYSAEGTLAHAVAAHCLLTNIDAAKILVFPHNDKNEIISSEMQEYIQEYLDYVRSFAIGHHLLVEQRLELEWLTGEKDAKGTADAVIISKDGATLRIIDFKFGFNEVEAENNPQLRIYGLAALRQFEMLGDFQKVILAIHQPRINNISDESVSLLDMKTFEQEVYTAIARVDAAKLSNSLDGFLVPGKKQCYWCKAAYKCPALTSQVANACGADFDDLDQTELVAPVDLGAAMAKTSLIETWLKAVRGKVESELLSGRLVTGYKLVEGKKGNRNWRDEDEAEKVMKAAKLTQSEMYNFNLLTPAKLEKNLKAKPKIWDKLSGLIIQKQGQPSVAPVNDPRPAYDSKPEADFEEIA